MKTNHAHHTRPRVLPALPPRFRIQLPAAPVRIAGAVSQPGRASAADIINLQASYGNQAVEKLLAGGSPKETLPAAASSRIQQARRGGEAIPPALRRRMEAGLGGDFSAVRLHSGSEADRLNRSVSARAFTVGKDIFFRRGELDTRSHSGLQTLAHELVHTVQQTSGPSRSAALRLGKPDDSFEQEAGRHSSAVLTGGITHPGAGSAAASGTIQRVKDKREIMEELAEIPGSVASGTGNQLGSLGTTLGTPFAKTPEQMQSTAYEVASAKTGAPMSVLGSTLDTFNTGKGIYDVVQSRRERNAMDAGGKKLGAEGAWKSEKNAVKSTAASGLSAASNITGSVANIGQAVGSTAPGISGAVSAAPIMSLVTGGIDVARKGYGMVRSANKARQLGSIKGKIGAEMSNMPDDEHKEKLGRLQQVAKFGQKQKGLRAGLLGAGVIGGALGVAGGAALLASNPVGWGLAGAGAAIGLGIGGYQLGKGLRRRSHRRDKLNQAEASLGMTDTDKAETGKLDWLLGRDIKKRQEALKNYAGANQAKVDALSDPQKEMLTRAKSSQKQRMSKELTEQLTDTAGRHTPRAGFARQIGQSLGVVSEESIFSKLKRKVKGGDYDPATESKAIKSRGWNIFKKQEDVDLKSLQSNDDEKDSLQGLIERKFKVQ